MSALEPGTPSLSRGPAALPPVPSRSSHAARTGASITWTDVAYAVVAPWVFSGVRLGSRWLGVTPAELRERAGRLPHACGPLLWFHGASAGELAAATHLVHALRTAGFGFSAAYTAANRAGTVVARRAAQARDLVALAPWDTPRSVARAFDRWQPRALFLVETELWPRLVYDAVRRGVPVFSVSARIYPRHEPRYRLIRPFIAPTVRRLTRILTQNETERARFVRLGADGERCVVAGDLKHAGAPIDASAGALLRAEMGIRGDDPIVVCGSIHADELSLLTTALVRLDAPDVRCVIAPRHAEAVDRVLTAARRLGWRAHRRAEGAPPAGWRVLVWDTYGELRHAYAMASVAVVGGSLMPHGGHNLLEPVSAGVPVLFGAHTSHCADDARRLMALTPEACVRGADDLAARLRVLLSDAGRRRDVLERQRRVLPDGQGIANQYVGVLSPWLREMGLERA